MTPSIFDPGLSFTAAAETSLSRIDSDSGNFEIRGYQIEELAEKAAYEEVTWLLFNGRLPTDDELGEFQNELIIARTLSEEVRSLIQSGAKETVSTIDVLRMALGAECLSSDSEDTISATRRVVAICPTIVAAYWRYRQGFDPIEPREDLSHTANFLYMLSGVEPTEPTVERLETYLTTIAEHGLNASTFTARIIGSAGSDPFSAATGAVGALKGSRHGGMLERVFEMLTDIDDETDLTEYVQERFENEGSLPGFGHVVYTIPDPRAEIVEQAAACINQQRGLPSLLSTARRLETAAEEVLTTNHPTQQLHVTVDYYAAVLLYELEIPPELFTALFAIGRSAGWMAHYLEQFESETLLRPRTRYTGPEERTWIPRSDRYIAGGSGPRSATTLKGLSSILGTLSEPVRLELLLILFESAEPLSYSSLRTLSSIDDKGRFNYHLRKLRSVYITNTEAGYSLAETGKQVVEMLLDDEQLLAQTIEETHRR